MKTSMFAALLLASTFIAGGATAHVAKASPKLLALAGGRVGSRRSRAVEWRREARS